MCFELHLMILYYARLSTHHTPHEENKKDVLETFETHMHETPAKVDALHNHDIIYMQGFNFLSVNCVQPPNPSRVA